MNFCFITTGYFSKNATMKRSLGMAPQLVACGHNVTLVLQDHPENRQLASEILNVESVFFPEIGTFKERHWKSSFVSKKKFDVIIYNSLGWRNAIIPAGLSTSALKLMEHCELESSNKSISFLRKILISVLEWWSLFAFNGHICSSRYLLDLMKRRAFIFNIQRFIFWSPYAVDTSVFLNSNFDSKVSVRNPVALIFHVGTVAENYGCLFMLRGLAELSRIRKDWRAVFAGKGNDLEAARSLVIELGLNDRVMFPGFLSEDDMRVELGRAKVFLSHLNDTEQDWARCPSKLYYYMALGKPIVTSTVGENRIALGDSGFYYKPDCPSDFARSLSDALDAPPNWRPHYTPQSVTWETRTREFLREIENWKNP